MEKSISAMSPKEFEALVQNVIDRRMSVWLTQLLDVLGGTEEDDTQMHPEFVNSLKRSIAQAEAGSAIDLQSFRAQLTNG